MLIKPEQVEVEMESVIDTRDYVMLSSVQLFEH